MHKIAQQRIITNFINNSPVDGYEDEPFPWQLLEFGNSNSDDGWMRE